MRVLVCQRMDASVQEMVIKRDRNYLHGSRGLSFFGCPLTESPDKTVTAIDVTSAHQEVLQRPRNNRTLLWR